MKKPICLILAGLLTLGLGACGGNDNADGSTDSKVESSVQSTDGNTQSTDNVSADGSATEESSVYVPTEEEIAYTEGLNFVLSDDRTYYHVGKYEGTSPDVVIPKYYNNLPVKTIGYDSQNRPFYNNKIVESVTIPSSIDFIKKDTFGFCTNLKKVYISDLTAWLNISFGNSASNPCCRPFEGEYENTSGEVALYLNGEILEEVTIPEGITKLNEYAFYGCTTLKTVTIPESVTEIGSSAFSCCKELSKVSITENIKYIGSHAFGGCDKLELTNGDFLPTENNPYFAMLYRPDDKKIPDGTVVIAGGAFSGDSFLNDVVIPDSVVSIGDHAFGGCYNLISVDLPASLEIIGDSAFDDCNDLELLELPGKVQKIGKYAFRNCHQIKEVVLPETVVEIGDSAFSTCLTLKKVTIPEATAVIGKKAFDNCHKIESIICGAKSQPEGWDAEWLGNCSAEITWGK